MLKYFTPRIGRLAARTASEAMSVAERIDSKRAQAMVGGGERRIQAQHKKVKIFILFAFLDNLTFMLSGNETLINATVIFKIGYFQRFCIYFLQLS